MNDRVLSLVNLMVSQRSNLVMPFAQHILENKTSSLSMNKGLLHLLQRLENERSCDEYDIGEQREFIITPFQSTILPYTYYRVKRESDKHYKAFIALKFFPGEGYDELVVPDNQNPTEYMMKKVKSCINKANSKMKGPYGEELEIVIEDAHQVDAHQVDACMPKHLVEIGKSHHRTYNVKYYHPGMDCDTLTHEILHVLGLWDEYEENREPKYDCRVVQENSMLSNYGMQWNNVFSDKRDDFLLSPSLLYPSHFQSILYGNCSLRDDVKLYRRCSRLSYQILSDENACLAEKDYCDRQNVLGRNKIAAQQKIRNEIQDVRSKLDELNVRLEINPEPPEDDTDYDRKMLIREKALAQQKIHQQKIRDLQAKLEIVSTWPDPLTL